MALIAARFTFATVAFAVSGMADAQDGTPTCGPDAQGMYTTECHLALLQIEKDAQHSRSYPLGYKDGCEASASDGLSVATMKMDADSNFSCVVTWQGTSWGGVPGTVAMVRPGGGIASSFS